MRYLHRKDPFCAWYGLADLPDPEEICAVCGGPIWAGEPVELNRDGEICHAACAEKEEACDG